MKCLGDNSFFYESTVTRHRNSLSIHLLKFSALFLNNVLNTHTQVFRTVIPIILSWLTPFLELYLLALTYRTVTTLVSTAPVTYSCKLLCNRTWFWPQPQLQHLINRNRNHWISQSLSALGGMVEIIEFNPLRFRWESWGPEKLIDLPKAHIRSKLANSLYQKSTPRSRWLFIKNQIHF